MPKSGQRYCYIFERAFSFFEKKFVYIKKNVYLCGRKFVNRVEF